ncbi:MAG: CRISPR-associated endonuclease Cas3'' [Candidatus Accumulibacter sp.]|nr:CRISPR-associated endonuclease Cas3'' [Accumulibacter sp.]MBL8393416.1 CRISPR-associated endonuclease Cas3'' [Accumulibacter sp.]
MQKSSAAPDRPIIAHRREADGQQQRLEDHLRSVGRLAARNASKLKVATDHGGQSARLDDAGEVLGLLHDLGKYSRAFQDYLGSAVGLIDQDADDFVDAQQLRGRIDHSTAGAQFIWRKLSQRGPVGSLSGQILALCIASHHSGLIDCITPEGEDNFTRRMNKAEQAAHFDEALARIDPAVLERLGELTVGANLSDRLQEIIVSLVKLEHRAERSEKVLQCKFGLLVRFLFSCLIDADRVDTADFERPRARHLRYHGQYSRWEELAGRLEARLEGFSDTNPVNRLRWEVSEHCRLAATRQQGVFTLTVPTGGGKTLASLRFALQHAQLHRLDRVIYVVPFTSIIDQNADVVRRILEPSEMGIEPGSIVLEHHSNLTPEEQTWRSKILSENWDAPVVHTTSVQLLETLFSAGTRGARRMHQLAKSVIIFDEVQTVPLRCIHLFNNAINFLVEHCGSTVVLCTATQPLLNAVNSRKGAARFQPKDEIIPGVQELFAALKRTEVIHRHRAGGWSDNEVAALAAEEVAASGSCLVIVNTRKAALSLYRTCAERLGYPVYHLSTSMCPAHRRKILSQIRQSLDRDYPVLCVSTQLIEAGVDVDFGAVIRHVAGLDSIAQAAGRCNRNGRRVLGRVHVINPADDGLERLCDIREGRNVAQRVLDEFEQDRSAFADDLLGPAGMGRYFDYYFGQRAGEMSYPVLPAATGRDDSLLNLLSENKLAVHDYSQRCKTAPAVPLRQAFMTAGQAFRAIDAPTTGIIVPFGAEGRDLVAQLCGVFDPELQFDLLRRAQQFSVNVFPQVFEALQRAAAITQIGEGIGIYHLRAEYYSNEFGLSQTQAEAMETLYV